LGELASRTLLKIKFFCPADNLDKRMEREVTDWKKIFTEDISDKKHKEFLKLNNERDKAVQFIKWVKDWQTPRQLRDK
jgi:hypothetical protein